MFCRWRHNAKYLGTTKGPESGLPLDLRMWWCTQGRPWQGRRTHRHTHTHTYGQVSKKPSKKTYTRICRSYPFVITKMECFAGMLWWNAIWYNFYNLKYVKNFISFFLWGRGGGSRPFICRPLQRIPTGGHSKLNFFVPLFNPSSANPIKWLNTLKIFVGNSRRIVWVKHTILWGWHLKS